MRSKKSFWKKQSSGWKNRFWPIFLVLPAMLLKTQLFEKDLICPSFFVLCSIKNLTKQFITHHIVFWHFLCIIKLHFVKTYKADGDFSKRTLFRMILAGFLSYCRVSRHQEANPLAQKKDSNKCCASYKINSAKTEWMLKTKTFKKKSHFSSEKNTFTIFLVIPTFADVHNNFITVHKVFKQIWCKWKGHFSKTW